jgi:hypothetical protein
MPPDSYYFNKIVDPVKIATVIGLNVVTPLLYVDLNDTSGSFTAWFADTLTAGEKTTLNALVAADNGKPFNPVGVRGIYHQAFNGPAGDSVINVGEVVRWQSRVDLNALASDTVQLVAKVSGEIAKLIDDSIGGVLRLRLAGGSFAVDGTVIAEQPIMQGTPLSPFTVSGATFARAAFAPQEFLKLSLDSGSAVNAVSARSLWIEIADDRGSN